MTTTSVQADRPATRGVACAHCGLPVPAGLVDRDREEQFCCAGCRAVHAVIGACGLEQYYALREATRVPGRPPRTTSKRYEEFDDPAFAELHCRIAPGGLHVTELYLEGIRCAACAWLIEKLPHLVPGVAEVRVDMQRSTARVLWDDDAVALSRIARQLAALGYLPHPARGGERRQRQRVEDRRFMIRIAIAGAIAGNVMLISIALYGGMFHGIEPALYTFFRWTCLVLMAASILGPGRVFFRGAWGALRARTVHMDVPVAVGIAAGGLWSAFTTVRGTGEIYSDSVTVLIFLLLVGRFIQLRQQRRSSDAIELLYSMTPSSARIVEDDVVREVPVEALRPGQTVEVRAGDSIPIDGVVAEGRSALNVALLTGESRSAPVEPGDAVHAGTSNLASRLLVEVTATGEATRVGRLMRLVEEGARRRAPVVQMADRLAGVFVTVVLVLAAATLAVWWPIEPERAVANAMSLLIVTCPCALGLATPLAIVAGVGRAARQGILIKGGAILERLRRPGLILLDKTGTITRGAYAVEAWHGPAALQPAVAALERSSAHPIGCALVAAYGDDAATAGDADAVETPGGGIRGMIDGREMIVGSASFLEASGARIPPDASARADGMARRAISPVFVAVDGVVEAVAGVGDAVAPETPGVVAALRARGWRVGILSGDHPAVVRAVAGRLGVEADESRGGVDPEGKVRVVEAARRAATTPVVMVGDGANDAAALAAATIGVAVRGGAEASLTAADVSLAEAGLSALPALLDGSRRTLAVIRRNLAASLAYNVVGASLAMAGIIHPLVAAVLMPVSSLSVITLSYRSRTFEPPSS